jgi:hypothetical protein
MVLICFFRFLLVFVRPLAVRTSQSLEASPTTVTLGSVTYYCRKAWKLHPLLEGERVKSEYRQNWLGFRVQISDFV